MKKFELNATELETVNVTELAKNIIAERVENAQSAFQLLPITSNVEFTNETDENIGAITEFKAKLEGEIKSNLFYAITPWENVIAKIAPEFTADDISVIMDVVNEADYIGTAFDKASMIDSMVAITRNAIKNHAK